MYIYPLFLDVFNNRYGHFMVTADSVPPQKDIGCEIPRTRSKFGDKEFSVSRTTGWKNNQEYQPCFAFYTRHLRTFLELHIRPGNFFPINYIFYLIVRHLWLVVGGATNRFTLLTEIRPTENITCRILYCIIVLLHVTFTEKIQYFSLFSFMNVSSN